jgi:hypothetical protein
VFPPSFIYEEKITNGESEVIIAPPRDLFTAANLKKFEVPWGDKVPTAFFRGTATGGGVTALTNQRLHAAQICYTWSSSSEYPHLCGRMGSGILGSKSKASGSATGHKNKIRKTTLGGGVGEGSEGGDGDEAGGGGGGGGGSGNVSNDSAGEANASNSNGTESDEVLGMEGPGSAPSSSSSAGPESASGTGTGTGIGVMEDSYYPYLDAKITGWNIRDKKTAGGKMTYLRKNNFQFEGDRKKNFVEIYKQVRIVNQISGLSTICVMVCMCDGLYV